MQCHRNLGTEVKISAGLSKASFIFFLKLLRICSFLQEGGRGSLDDIGRVGGLRALQVCGCSTSAHEQPPQF